MHFSASSLVASTLLLTTTLSAPLATGDFSQSSANHLDLTSIHTLPNGQGQDTIQFIVTHTGTSTTRTSLCTGEAKMDSETFPAKGSLNCPDGTKVEFEVEKRHGNVTAKCTAPEWENEPVVWVMVESGCVHKKHDGNHATLCTYENAGDLKATNSSGTGW
ncbi:hypothetical protein B0J14DRAFT_695518 [Halenospora varia]|nr:hypothetical protein B0J14DRAFT_695518 [Halenospora varia]